MKRVRKQLLSLLVLALALATVLSVSLFSSSAEEVTYGSATAIENYERYSGSLTNPTDYPETPTKNADWSGGSIGSTYQIADSIKMQTEGYAYYVDLEYYSDAQWAGNLGIRLRNNWNNSSSADRVALYAVENGGIIVGNALFQLADPGAKTETIPVTGYGWHHVRGKLVQTAKAVQDPETLKWSLDYDFSMSFYVDGVLVKTFEAIEGAFESHHFYLYHAAVDADTGAITYKSVKELYELETSLSTLEGDAKTEAEATLAAYGYAYGGSKKDFTYVYATSLSGLFNRGDDFAGMQRTRALTVSWGSQAKFEVSPVKYNLNGGSLVTEAPVVEPQNVPATVKNGYTWVGVPGATYAFTEVDHYYVDDGAGKTVTPAAAEKLGAAFLGWYTDEACTVAYDAATQKIGAVTLYAKYSEPGSYSLTVDMLDGNSPAVCYPTDESFTFGDEAELWIATDGKAYAAGDVLTLTANVTVYPVSLELLEGASVRLDAEHSGLRFESVLSTALYDALYESCGILDWEIGTLILPTDLLGGGTLTHATDGALVLNNLEDGVSLKVDREDGTVTFYAAIVDIKVSNYARAFSAVSYLKIGDKYAYSSYIPAYHSRSVYDVAVEAYEGALAGNAIVKGYLDGVLRLSVADGSVSVLTPNGYVSPYTATLANDVLTVTATDGTLVSGDVGVIVIDGTTYVGGWTVADNKLTAPYAPQFRYDFTGVAFDKSTNTDTANGYYEYKSGAFKFAFYSGKVKQDETGYGTVYGTVDGTKSGESLGYVKLLYEASDSGAGAFNFQRTNGLSGLLGEHRSVFSVSMSLKLEPGYANAPTCQFALRGKGGSSERAYVFKLHADGTVKLNDGQLIATLNDSSFTDITVTVDLANNIVYAYANGTLVATMEGGLAVPATVSATYGSDLLRWAMERCTSYIYNGANLKSAVKAGICVDNIAIRAH